MLVDMILTPPYKSMDIANYIVTKTGNQKDGAITYELLNPILYYCQAYFLVNENRPLFQEEIHIWGHGPTEPIVNSYYKEFGAAPLHRPVGYAIRQGDGHLACIDPDNRQLRPADKEKIDFVINQLVPKYRLIPFQLVRHTQQEPMWQAAKTQLHQGNLNQIYQHDDLIKYFGDNQHWPWSKPVSNSN